MSAARKTERVMNLAICLLMARRFVDKGQIRATVEGYAGLGDAAFERTFERDKDDLRALGVPVETGSNSPLFPDEVGYRIRREAFELPAIQVSPSEAAVLGLASRVWESATQADQTTTALAKLRAAGIEPEPQRLLGLSASIGAKEEGFEPLWRATVERTPVRFDYRGEERVVEPWAMTYRNGAWYLIGRDRARGERRTFKVARLTSGVRVAGRAGTVVAPAVERADALIGMEPSAVDAVASVGIRGECAPGLRRRGELVGEDPRLPSGFSLYAVPFAAPDHLVAEVCSYGAEVIVLEPAEVRSAVIEHLSQVGGAD